MRWIDVGRPLETEGAAQQKHGAVNEQVGPRVGGVETSGIRACWLKSSALWAGVV